MKILILGGTGPMGTYLIENLRERASEILVTSRRERESTGAVRYQKGNAKDPCFLQGLLAQHWDAMVDFMVYTTDEFSARVDSLLAATDQYFFLSSARVYAASELPLTETSPRLLDVCNDTDYLATDEYALAKARQENLLFQHSKKNWTIIRPYITYGPERLQLGVLEKEAWLYRAIHGRTIIFNKDIAKKKTTMTHGRDVARAMAVLVGEKKAMGEAFHITGEDLETWESILELYRDCLCDQGYPVKTKQVGLEQFILCHSGRYQIIYDRLYDRAFDNSKISLFLKISGFEPTQSGLADCLKTFLRHPIFGTINWSREGIKDRYCAQWVKPTEIKGAGSVLKYINKRLRP